VVEYQLRESKNSYLVSWFGVPQVFGAKKLAEEFGTIDY
jgi:hypothetical protein